MTTEAYFAAFGIGSYLKDSLSLLYEIKPQNNPQFIRAVQALAFIGFITHFLTFLEECVESALSHAYDLSLISSDECVFDISSPKTSKLPLWVAERVILDYTGALPESLKQLGRMKERFISLADFVLNFYLQMMNLATSNKMCDS
ncbi:hypothetical protein BLNAU_8184 [Blattamonas nauphoetae]|uniref:Uncharacterized protein n=1 Tax=Blattamonas nauphoetae TaxID=2049346 RepID=A0ABQ9XZK4_9EUKA|nr:hypothetical protein BLNAU_8184 [Blattamonas nauphoetae]